MKFLFLDSWARGSAEGSGTAVAIRGLDRALTSMGHDVKRFPEKLSATPSFFSRLKANFQVRSYVTRHMFDAVIGFDIDGFALAPSKLEVPYVVSIKGVAAEEAKQEKGAPHLFLSALAKLERRNVRHADAVVTTSEYCRQAIAENYGIDSKKIAIVPEGIDLAWWRAHLKIDPSTRKGNQVLCVARQYPRKRVIDLVDATQILVKRIPNIKVVIVGSGPEHVSIRRRVQALGLNNAIDLVGEVPDDATVAKYYAESDLFCLPSIQEGFGIVFLEAMASALPIVSTFSAAIPEVVSKDVGFLVEPKNPKALSDRMFELLTHSELRRRMGEAGLKQIESFDWIHVAKKFIRTVQNLV